MKHDDGGYGVGRRMTTRMLRPRSWVAAGLLATTSPVWAVVLNCGDAVGPGLVTADNDLTCPAAMGSPALTVVYGTCEQ